MLSSKGVTPYKYGAKNIYIAKIYKKRKKTCSKNGKICSKYGRPYHGTKELSSRTK
jgi:hypothetical protein